VGEEINMQQQNVVFGQQTVLLDGGVKMTVAGEMTYHVSEPLTVIRKIGYSALLPAITNVSKAELSRIFSALHMEQLTSSQSGDRYGQPVSQYGGAPSDPTPVSVTGDVANVAADDKRGSRSVICSNVVKAIAPMVEEWGVRIIAFQLESIKLADASYARDYEEASLSMVKAKANLRSMQAQNEITLSTAEANARSVRISADGKKNAVIIAAQADAESRKIDADARAKAAQLMANPFAQQLALAQLAANVQIDVAKTLRIDRLTVSTDANLGKMVSSQALFNPQTMAAMAVQGK